MFMRTTSNHQNVILSLPGVIVTLERLQTTSGLGDKKATGFSKNFNEAWNRNRSSVEVQRDVNDTNILPEGFVFSPARGFVLEEPQHEVIQKEVSYIYVQVHTWRLVKARINVVDGLPQFLP